MKVVVIVFFFYSLRSSVVLAGLSNNLGIILHRINIDAFILHLFGSKDNAPLTALSVFLLLFKPWS